MKLLSLLSILIFLAGCSSMQAHNNYKQQRIQIALKEAKRMGNSQPLYDLYEDCLNLGWLDALDSGNDDLDAYQAGLDQCASELSSLCDYYGVNTCKQDADISHRVLFSMLMKSYRQDLQKRPESLVESQIHQAEQTDYH